MQYKCSQSEICWEKVNQFIKENKLFLENKAVKSFLEVERNKKLFFHVISYPTPENKRILDEEFRKHFFTIRFTAFISSLIYYNAINYDKRHRMLSNRYQLTLDKPIGVNHEKQSFKDLLKDSYSQIQIDNILESSDIKDYLSEELYVKAIDQLTKKQKEVINLAYVKGYSDTEIGTLLGKSQQAISKLHKKALEKMHKFIQENRENNDFS